MVENTEEMAKKLEEFILIMRSSTITENSDKRDVPLELLDRLGYIKGTLPSHSIVQKWYAKGKQYRKPKIRLVHFKNSELDEEGFIGFLSEKLKDTWIDLREKFNKVDRRFDIKHEKAFYYELLIYFLELIDLTVPNDIRSKHAQGLQLQKEDSLQIHKENALKKKYLELDANKPKSGIMLSYLVSPHFSQMVKRINDSEFNDWEEVVDEVLSYRKISAMQMKNFSDASIKQGLDTLHKTWLNPDDTNSILAAIGKLK